MPGLADQWIEEGKQFGLEKGRQEGRLEGLLQGFEWALELKFGDKGLKFFRRIAK